MAREGKERWKGKRVRKRRTRNREEGGAEEVGQALWIT